jgi:methylmalonyl-CoA mutase N-terminal domain/subunit
MIEAASSKLHMLKQAWQAGPLATQVQRFGERRPRFTTSSDTLEVQPLYTPDDLDGAAPLQDATESYARQLGFPGDYPFTRGVQPKYVPRPLLDHAPVCRVRYGCRI